MRREVHEGRRGDQSAASKGDIVSNELDVGENE